MTPVDLPAPPQHLIETTVRVVSPTPSNSGSTGWGARLPRIYSFSVQSAAAPWIRDAVSKVSELTALRPDWDTYGANAVDAAAAARVAEFLLDHAFGDLSAPSVVPMTDGGLQLEWHRGGLNLEISFSSTEPGVYIEDLDSQEIREEPLEEAGRLLRHYHSRLAA